MADDLAMRTVTIVGGGFSGVSAAVQLVRASAVPLAVTIVEPREQVGPGLAYSASDPDHRLNGPLWSHSVLAEDASHFTRWCERDGILARDPQAQAADGNAFVRRADYGRYLADSLREHARWPATGSTICHLRGRASGAAFGDGVIATSTDAGPVLHSTMLIVATGNPLPHLQPPIAAELAAYPSVVANPLEPGSLQRIDSRARVLVVGSGLTALDVVSTLLRDVDRPGIVVVSRHGLRPRPQPPAARPGPDIPGAGAASDQAVERPLDRILGQVPPFLLPPGTPPTLRGWVRALRARIREVEVQGESWHKGFDDLRDVVWRAWPLLPIEQKRRFLRRLRAWYDVHRFRAPPQNDAIVRAAEAQGRIEFRAARLRAVAPLADGARFEVRLAGHRGAGDRAEVFDAIVNCTGLDAAAGARTNPFLWSLVERGALRIDETGIGFGVDAHCRAIGADGRANPSLRVIGPPTAGTFGDPLGAMFIAAQVYRMLPDALDTLAKASGEGAAR